MGVIPQGQNAFSRLLTRSARSVVGANVTIEIDKRMRKLRPGTVATQSSNRIRKSSFSRKLYNGCSRRSHKNGNWRIYSC